MKLQRDIPGLIATWLAGLGKIWALILVPLTVFVFLPIHGPWRIWPLGLYFVAGYLVWFGWHWRGQAPRQLPKALALWVVSTGFNSLPVIAVFTHEWQWSDVFLNDAMAFLFWWWAAATLASAVAFCLELSPWRNKLTCA